MKSAELSSSLNEFYRHKEVCKGDYSRTVQLTYTPSPPHIHRGYYTAARRYEKLKLTSLSRCVIFFLLHRQEHLCTNNSLKAGNDVIDILTGEDMENLPLESRMQFCTYASGLFSTKKNFWSI